MVGVRQDFIYSVVRTVSSPNIAMFVNVDADSTSLILNSQVNTAVNLGELAIEIKAYISPASGRRGLNIAARGVQIEYTGDLPPAVTSLRVWVVVFRVSRFNAYAVGQTGTFKGLPVTCVAKFDGRPNITGGFGV